MHVQARSVLEEICPIATLYEACFQSLDADREQEYSQINIIKP